MTDDELVAWLHNDRARDWPTQRIRLWPRIDILDPLRWRAVLREEWATGDSAKRGAVLKELRRLRTVLGQRT